MNFLENNPARLVKEELFRSQKRKIFFGLHNEETQMQMIT